MTAVLAHRLESNTLYVVLEFMNRTFKVILVWIYILLSFCQAQSLNRLDRQGKRHGRWITYWDSAKAVKMVDNKFRHGRPRGKSSYYRINGSLERTERVRFGKIKTLLYSPEGKVQMKGNARIENLPDKVHYYFYGRWKSYDDHGKLLKYCYYEKGGLVRTRYVNKSILLNDSLTFALNALERNFRENNGPLLDSIMLASNANRDILQVRLFARDTVTFLSLQKILSVYGYPGKNKVGEASDIPFVILNSAPAIIKQAYIPMLMTAAKDGAFSISALAFFIDKCRLDLGQKQLYGTQFYMKNKEWVLYDVEDPEGLPERRSQMGLPE